MTDSLDEIVESRVRGCVGEDRVLYFEAIFEGKQFCVFDGELDEAADRAANLK